MDNHLTAQAIMREFAAATGLMEGGGEPRRYLWTDAFAVCNYLGFFRDSDDSAFLELALKLVEQVHEHLGKHRRDSAGSGWLSGLTETQGRLHPTCAGLRIGKPLDERKLHEAVDETLEWQQDGQYFHYLTRWMHALDAVSRATNNGLYNQWARSLAQVAYQAFVYTPTAGAAKRMYWKMSIDLSRPLVSSMGHHDPLDGLITYWQLEASAKHFSATVAQSATMAQSPTMAQVPTGLSLLAAIEDFSSMCAGQHWATQDELGMGSMLSDACRLAQLVAAGSVADSGLLEQLLVESDVSLQAFSSHNRLGLEAEYRLAFRELGLAIGLQGINIIHQCLQQQPEKYTDAKRLLSRLEALQNFTAIAEHIVNFWTQSPHRSGHSWSEHADINNVMLATSLAPGGYLQR
ncbi:hypothetical protein G8770_06470 [Aestuariicella hydrocarbonica]|uniref:Uncharacterized protein n=1 Tax=Pseudomaricurvus hydrocarbonicus TaxID=1470433 RepID=A0A9E5JUL5_9GAMM|nr:hypothetical protein [Aestuariicella hydrocarbonica]NHO65185.1 hypothetical protein [Aestuariicella hydrocarbonica]